MAVNDITKMLSEILPKIFDGIKALFAAWVVRRATQLEIEKNELKTSNEIQKEQLDIAAEPDASPGSVRDRMRNGQL